MIILIGFFFVCLFFWHSAVFGWHSFSGEISFLWLFTFDVLIIILGLLDYSLYLAFSCYLRLCFKSWIKQYSEWLWLISHFGLIKNRDYQFSFPLKNAQPEAQGLFCFASKHHLRSLEQVWKNNWHFKLIEHLLFVYTGHCLRILRVHQWTDGQKQKICAFIELIFDLRWIGGNRQNKKQI